MPFRSYRFYFRLKKTSVEIFKKRRRITDDKDLSTSSLFFHTRIISKIVRKLYVKHKLSKTDALMGPVFKMVIEVVRSCFSAIVRILIWIFFFNGNV